MIWVIDDRLDVAESIVLVLITEGLQAVALTSGNSVVTLLDQGERPELMVLDLYMPGNGGLVILDRLITDPSLVFPVIVLTGYDEMLTPLYTRRILTVLTKPPDPLVLIARVKQALGGV